MEKEGVGALKWCHRDNGKGEVKIERGKGIRGEEAREKWKAEGKVVLQGIRDQR